MLEFKNVSKRYNLITALDKVCFQINPGEIVGLIGANGAGKTTAIRLLTHYLTPDEGEIIINDTCSYALPERQQKISLIPDEPVYYDFMTVAEHFSFIHSMYPNGEYGIEQLINQFELNDHLKKMPHTLSKGNKQKLSICTALLRNFDYLVADEPFTGLDPKQINRLKETIFDLRARGKGVLISTHLLDVIDLFCNSYVMIDKGRVIAKGTKEEILRNGNMNQKLSIEEAYIILTDYNGEVLHQSEINSKGSTEE